MVIFGYSPLVLHFKPLIQIQSLRIPPRREENLSNTSNTQIVFPSSKKTLVSFMNSIKVLFFPSHYYECIKQVFLIRVKTS